MGRRGLKNKRDDDEDEIKLEREWERKRRRAIPADGGGGDGDNNNGSERVVAGRDDDAEGEKRKIDSTTEADDAAASAASPPAPAGKTKMERQRLKKQRQKERQREKKARRANPADGGDKNNGSERTVGGAVAGRDENDGGGKPEGETDAKIESGKAGTETASAAESEQKKIEQQRLKKQRQKERQREKKAEAKELKQRAEDKRRAQAKERKVQKEKKDSTNKAIREASKGSQQYTTLRKGVRCFDVVVGTGAVVEDRKKVRVEYTLRGKSHTAGKILDSSSSFAFRLGRGEVIQGWDIGVEGMRRGGIRRLVVPKDAGYGNKDIGAGKGADLFFQITLL